MCYLQNLMIGEAYLSWVIITIDFQNGEWHSSLVKKQEEYPGQGFLSFELVLFSYEDVPFLWSNDHYCYVLFSTSKCFGLNGFTTTECTGCFRTFSFLFLSPKCTPKCGLLSSTIYVISVRVLLQATDLCIVENVMT